MKTGIVWLRRNLRLDDNKVIASAIAECDLLYFTFVLDSNILPHFPNPNDRRLSFIINTLEKIDKELSEFGGKLLILIGSAKELIPLLAQDIKADYIFADEDFEPSSIERDRNIKESLLSGTNFKLALDHLLFNPSDIVKQNGESFKVFTPYMKNFRENITPRHLITYQYALKDKLTSLHLSVNSLLSNKIYTFSAAFTKEFILKKVGYEYQEDDLWKVDEAHIKLDNFIDNKLTGYEHTRDYLDQEGTSRLSPYLRFGLLSIRECFKRALVNNFGYKWVNELIWREFNTSILYHFPESANREFQIKYYKKLPWNKDQNKYQAFIEGKTGFPVVDAAINQLLQEGWIHNRARMLVASFFCKNLFMDWRLGEKFFSQYLMDYELASNIGGWQWCASTGTDAQPYFRIFNPITQAQKFDPSGAYVRKYLPILQEVNIKHIHDGEKIAKLYNIDYPLPITDYKLSREEVINMFKSIK